MCSYSTVNGWIAMQSMVKALKVRVVNRQTTAGQSFDLAAVTIVSMGETPASLFSYFGHP